MKIVTVVGARPQFIKAAAGSRILRQKYTEILVHTGQHYDVNMSDVFFEEMNIPRPDYNLGVSGGSHGEMTGRMLIEIEKVLIKEKPDALMVYGDTNSTLAAALAAVKLHIPIIHVEAGNRLGTLSNPEEVNRILTDHCSTLLLCATEDAKQHLIKEGLGNKAYVIGNIMYDSYLSFADACKKPMQLTSLNGIKIDIPDNFYYMTCHRQENTDDDEKLKQILDAMNSLDSPTIYPVHPRNHQRVLRLQSQYSYHNLILIPPVKYSDSVYFVSHAKKVVTDSGGLQCEAFYAGVQCVFIFDAIAWPETMVNNRNQLAKPDKLDILEKLSKSQYIDPQYQPFGDGHAADKLTEIISQFFEKN